MKRISCWREHGSYGDASCKRLEEIHDCRICSEYIEAGRSLLDRQPSEAYREKLTQLCASQSADYRESDLSLGIFRVNKEWFALSTMALLRVIPFSPVHSVPHRSNKVFRGLTNVNGELLLSFSLSAALEIPEETHNLANDQRRMVVSNINGQRWVFDVEQFLGITRSDSKQIKPTPNTVSKATASYSRGVLPIDILTSFSGFSGEAADIAILDEKLLASKFERSLEG